MFAAVREPLRRRARRRPAAARLPDAEPRGRLGARQDRRCGAGGWRRGARPSRRRRLRRPRQPRRPSLVHGDLAAVDALPRRVPVPSLRPGGSTVRARPASRSSEARVVVMLDEGGVGDGPGQAARQGRRDRADPRARRRRPTTSRARSTAWQADGPIDGVYWLPALDDEGDLALDLAALARGAAPPGQDALRHDAPALRRQPVPGRRPPGWAATTATTPPAPPRRWAARSPASPSRTRRSGPTRWSRRSTSRPAARPATVADAAGRGDPARPGLRRDRPRRRPALRRRPSSSVPFPPLRPTGSAARRGRHGARRRTASSWSPAPPAASSRRSPPTSPAASGGTFHLLDLTPTPDPADPDLAAFRDRPGRPQGHDRGPHEGARASGRRRWPSRRSSPASSG